MDRREPQGEKDETRSDRGGLWIPIALFVVPAILIVVLYMVIRSLAAPPG